MRGELACETRTSDGLVEQQKLALKTAERSVSVTKVKQHAACTVFQEK